MTGEILEINVTSRADRVTINNAIEILKSARTHDPDAKVDLIIYHVAKEVRQKIGGRPLTATGSGVR